RYDNPVQYTFHKNIYHELRAITDIIFIEFNAATDGKDDSMTSF
ncbi:MAG: putative KAP-like P-loop ATPase, partial [Granulosicoccus sp.]